MFVEGLMAAGAIESLNGDCESVIVLWDLFGMWVLQTNGPMTKEGWV